MNVDMNELLALNGANIESVLYKGQSIKLPSSVKTHMVKQGETFWNISNAYGISMQSLMKANDASAGTVLYPGMVLYIPRQRAAPIRPHRGGTGSQRLRSRPLLRQGRSPMLPIPPIRYKAVTTFGRWV